MNNASATATDLIFRVDDAQHQATFGADYNGHYTVKAPDGTVLGTFDLNAANGWFAHFSMAPGLDHVDVVGDLLDDKVYEGNETVSINAAVNGAPSWTHSTNAIINDDEAAPRVISLTRYADGNEDGSSWPGWTLTLSTASSTEQQATLNFRNGYAGQTATFGQDYTGWVNVHALDGTLLQTVFVGDAGAGASGVIKIPAGATGVRLYAQPKDDAIIEGDETIKIWAHVAPTDDVWSEAAIIHDNEVATTGGFAKGVEDTPLTLTWDTFHVSNTLTGNNLGIALNSLPADGKLILNGISVVAGQVISKADIDAGKLIFNPDLNESGENRYNAVGVGNKLNDYAQFKYSPTLNGNFLGNPATFEVDIAPKADLGTLSASTILYSLTDFNSLAGVGTGSSGFGWKQFKSTVTGLSPDGDGSERTMIAISTKSSDFNLADSRQQVAVADANGIFHLVAPDSNGLYLVDPNSFFYVSRFPGSTGGSGYAFSFTLHQQEVNANGTVLDVAISTPKFNTIWGSPLVLDLNGDGVHTVDIEHGVQFDLLNQGAKVQTGWVDKHDGLLVLDLNHDGKINTGAELFGEATKLADGSIAKNGFEALAQYDGNHDGKIDANDAIFAQLKVWVDANSDGITQEGELLSLAQAGVRSIGMASQSSTATDNGNLLGLIGGYTGSDGAQHEMVDVWFQNGISSASSTKSDAMAPLVFDLNHDGHIDYSHITMAMDGQKVDTAWAGPADAILVWNKFGDGLVHDSSQYVFGQKTGSDLSGLQQSFDSNNDFVFNARDAQFNQFGLWQDGNQNGVVDAGEFHTLAQLGIASLSLISDGMVSTPVNGVTVNGHTTATMLDGSSLLVADATFSFVHSAAENVINATPYHQPMLYPAAVL